MTMLMTAANYSFHPLTGIFPAMTYEQLERLAEQIIIDGGLLEPIVLSGPLIIDGRARSRACEMLGITPDYVQFEGSEEDILPFIVKANLPRRELGSEQRAMIAAGLVNVGSNYIASQWKPGPNSLTQYAVTSKSIAPMFGINRSTVNKAKMILAKATPEVVVAVEQGRMSISRGYETTVPAGRRPVVAKLTVEERAAALRTRSNIYSHLRLGVDELTSLPKPADVAAIARALDRSDFIARKVPLALKWLQEFNECLSSKS
jgi:hypothetical protein